MVKLKYVVFQKCCVCKESLRNKNKNKNVTRIGTKSIDRIKLFFNNQNIKINDYICSSCRNRYSKNKMNPQTSKSKIKNPSVINISDVSDDNDDNVEKNINTEEQFEKEKKIKLLKANSSHKNCLICKRKTGLHQVKTESVLFAYQHFGIVIKPDSRCCNKHLEINGLIKESEYKQIPTKNSWFDKQIVKLLDCSIQKIDRIQYDLNFSSGVFDKFKDLASLEDEFCKKITGWSRCELENFSNYIKNLKDTAGRTKLQLVALYRYWLSKGIDQCTLALLKCNTSQQQISHYLSQIRTAMNQDVVHLFLGAKREKKFFLKHNTESVKILHNFDDDQLAVICDGTYTKLEKSANNEFQYLSYSIQKTHNLLKPFIICCADGYFIDCYGPFQANMNDATIFRKILDTDEDLRLLFTPKHKITIFFDRGK